MNQETTVCVECKSEYFKASSKMVSLCVNCVHYLYGYPNCIHEFQDGNCKNVAGMELLQNSYKQYPKTTTKITL